MLYIFTIILRINTPNLIAVDGNRFTICYSDGLELQCSIGPHTKNRKYWIQLQGPIHKKIIPIKIKRLHKLQTHLWKIFNYRTTVFIDSVSTQEWHKLKMLLWSIDSNT